MAITSRESLIRGAGSSASSNSWLELRSRSLFSWPLLKAKPNSLTFQNISSAQPAAREAAAAGKTAARAGLAAEKK